MGVGVGGVVKKSLQWSLLGIQLTSQGNRGQLVGQESGRPSWLMCSLAGKQTHSSPRPSLCTAQTIALDTPR